MYRTHVKGRIFKDPSPFFHHSVVKSIVTLVQELRIVFFHHIEKKTTILKFYSLCIFETTYGDLELRKCE